MQPRRRPGPGRNPCHLLLFLALPPDRACCTVASRSFVHSFSVSPTLRRSSTLHFDLIHHQVLHPGTDRVVDGIVLRSHGDPPILRRICQFLVGWDVVHSEHWWHNDYAEIPQFHGSRFLHGWCCIHVTNVLCIVLVVFGICQRSTFDEYVNERRNSHGLYCLVAIDLVGIICGHFGGTSIRDPRSTRGWWWWRRYQRRGTAQQQQ